MDGVECLRTWTRDDIIIRKEDVVHPLPLLSLRRLSLLPGFELLEFHVIDAFRFTLFPLGAIAGNSAMSQELR